MALIKLNKLALPTGNVLQVITDTYADATTTSGTFATIKTMSITKIKSTSTVLIAMSGMHYIDASGSGWAGGSIRVQRNADSGGAANFATTDFLGGESVTNYINGSLGNTFVDSTGTGTSISYTFDIKKSSDATTFGLGGSHHSGDGESNYITLMEIGT